MLDRLEADLDGAAHRLIGIEMAADVGLRLVGLLDKRCQLISRKAKPQDGELARSRAASRHNLDELGAFAQLFAHGEADGLDAVDDAADRSEAAIQRFDVAPVKGLADVGMTAGLDERLAANKETRPFNDLFSDSALEAGVGAAEVTHAGEPPQKHLLHDAGGMQRDVRIRQAREVGRIGEWRHDVDVTVDEARHQGLAAQVDAVGGGILDRLVRNLLDEAVRHTDKTVMLPFVAGPVENARVFEDRRLHGSSGSSLVSPRAGERRSSFISAGLTGAM